MTDAPGASLNTVRARLQGEALDALVALTVDHLLDRPVDQLLEPGFVAEQVVTALETASRDARTRTFLHEQLASLRTQVPAGTPAKFVPQEVLGPLQKVLERPVVFDRVLVERILDHDAARHLVTDLLQTSLRRYVERLRPVASTVASGVQRSPGFSRLKMLSHGVRGIGEGMLGGVSKELEHRAEGMVREFVDSALHSAMSQVAGHVCDPANADSYADYRVHVLHTVLGTANQTLVDELEKFDPELVVDLTLGVAGALAHREGFQGEVARAVSQALDSTGGRSLRDFLRETGLEGETGDAAELVWRQRIEARIADEARVMVQGPMFDAWLTALLAP